MTYCHSNTMKCYSRSTVIQELQKNCERYYLIRCVALHNITFHFYTHFRQQLMLDMITQTATSHPQLALSIWQFKHRAILIQIKAPILFRFHSLFMNQWLQSPELILQFNCAVQILYLILWGRVFRIWRWGNGCDNIRKPLNKWKWWNCRSMRRH